MALTEEASGSQTTILTTEHTLATRTDGKPYVLVVDIASLAADERLTIRHKAKVLTGGTTRLVQAVNVIGGGTRAQYISVPWVSKWEVVATIEQNGGIVGAFPWSLLSLHDAVTVLETGTSGAADRTPGNPHTLFTNTSGKTCVFVWDANALAADEAAFVEIFTKCRSGDTSRLYDRQFVNGATKDLGPVGMSQPIPALHEIVVKLTQTNAGTERSFPWELYQLD